MRIDYEYIKASLKKELDILIVGNMKFLEKIAKKLENFATVNMIKADPFKFYPSMSNLGFRMFDEAAISKVPDLIQYMPYPNYEDKLKAIKNDPWCIFHITYPSEEMIHACLKTSNAISLLILKERHTALTNQTLKSLSEVLDNRHREPNLVEQ